MSTLMEYFPSQITGNISSQSISNSGLTDKEGYLAFVIKCTAGAMIPCLVSMTGMLTPSIDNTVYVSKLPTPNLANSVSISPAFQAGITHQKWKERILNISLPTEIDDLEATVDDLLAYVDDQEDHWQAIDLKGLNGSKINVEHLAVILRTTFHVKHQISGWDEAIGVAKEAAIKAQISAEDVLFGLLNNDRST